MRTLRTALTVAALCLLAGGYGASQWAFFTGRTADYAKTVDNPVLKWLSAVLLIAAVLLTLVPDRSSEGEPE